MMLCKEETALPVVVPAQLLQLSPQERFLEELLSQPDRHGHRERTEAAGGKRQVCFQQALELQERLVIKRDVIDLVQPDAGFAETVGDGMPRKTGVVPLPAEPLLLRSGNDTPVLHESGRAVMIEGGNAQDPHALLRTACR